MKRDAKLSSAPRSLRQQVLGGGGVMMVRWLVGTVVSLAGMVVLTRVLGPAEFGAYAAVLAIFLFAQSLAAFGAGVFVVRAPGKLEQITVNAALWLAICGGFVTACLSLLLAVYALPVLKGAADGGVGPALGLLAIWPAAVASIYLSLVERELAFSRVALVELSNQLLFFVIAVPLALQWKTALAPAVALMAQQVVAVLGFRLAARAPWPGKTSRAAVREVAGYGATHTASQWLWQCRHLVNPIVVGGLAGSAAVGQVALSIRLVESLGFVRTVSWRLAVAALARVRDDVAKVREVVAEGALLQAVALGLPCFVFGLLAPSLVPRLFGPGWSEVEVLVPLLAVGYMWNAASNMLSSSLYVIGRNSAVATMHACNLVMLTVAAGVLVPRIGPIGYGFAEVLAIASYALVLRAFVASYGPPRLRELLSWLLVMSLFLLGSAGLLVWWFPIGAAIVTTLARRPRDFATLTFRQLAATARDSRRHGSAA